MLRTVRYIDTPAPERSRLARLFAQRVARTPEIADGARAAYSFIVTEADAGRLVGVDDLARQFKVTERTAYRWLADLARLDVLRAR